MNIWLSKGAEKPPAGYTLANSVEDAKRLLTDNKTHFLYIGLDSFDRNYTALGQLKWWLYDNPQFMPSNFEFYPLISYYDSSVDKYPDSKYFRKVIEDFKRLPNFPSSF